MPTCNLALCAGRFLLNALSRAEIRAHADGDRTSDYFVVPVEDGGVILVAGVSGQSKENELHYRPAEHRGWGAGLYPDGLDGGRFTEIYRSSHSDLATDTNLVVTAVQAVIAG
ncbi:hypothetical protein OG413_41465 [Streptomyces sp. NBC_01433]|uniref:hypothetical protein n=1 Tax=Streptomyces sp. NBC_01433 TaxID=2903864 RepID=UPI002258DF87|nr:hypothetical protein [Streptomyces sp. NBC_01433]MCX4681673.1 hypothetical protein [Streptomyces sp. NBC_01433]